MQLSIGIYEDGDLDGGVDGQTFGRHRQFTYQPPLLSHGPHLQVPNHPWTCLQGPSWDRHIPSAPALIKEQATEASCPWGLEHTAFLAATPFTKYVCKKRALFSQHFPYTLVINSIANSPARTCDGSWWASYHFWLQFSARA